MEEPSAGHPENDITLTVIAKSAGATKRRWRWSWRVCATVIFRLLVIVLGVGMAFFIARITAFNTHPDEFVHVDAFEYYRTHWIRPPPGSPLVYYSVYGWSRVFTGEIVYFLYGKVAALPLRHWPGVNPFFVYRLCNVGLLLITLAVLMFARCRLIAPWVLGIFLISIPQVIYVYAYANSDAFGISASILLFLQTARMLDKPLREWKWWSIGCLMFLFLCTMLSKIAFTLGIVLPLALIAGHLIRNRAGMKLIVVRLIVPMLVVYAFCAWWNPQLSPGRGKWNQRMTAMRQELAGPGRKPQDNAWVPGVFLAKQHWTYGQMLRQYGNGWLRNSAQSFYGQFGYMTIVIAPWIYAAAAYMALGLLLLTLCAVVVYFRRMSWELWLCIASSPGVFAANLFGSMFHSLHIDYQPQGRYMFAALPAIFFLCFGSWPVEGRWWRALRGMVLMLAMACSLYVLFRYVGMEPSLR